MSDSPPKLPEKVDDSHLYLANQVLSLQAEIERLTNFARQLWFEVHGDDQHFEKAITNVLNGEQDE